MSETDDELLDRKVREVLDRFAQEAAASTFGTPITMPGAALTLESLRESMRKFLEANGERVWFYSYFWRCPMCKLWLPREVDLCRVCGITRGDAPPEPAPRLNEVVFG